MSARPFIEQKYSTITSLLADQGHTSPMTTARYPETNAEHLDNVVLALCA